VDSSTGRDFAQAEACGSGALVLSGPHSGPYSLGIADDLARVLGYQEG
jgi:hypothetical protein